MDPYSLKPLLKVWTELAEVVKKTGEIPNAPQAQDFGKFRSPIRHTEEMLGERFPRRLVVRLSAVRKIHDRDAIKMAVFDADFTAKTE